MGTYGTIVSCSLDSGPKYGDTEDGIINREHESRSEECNIDVGRVKRGPGLRTAQEALMVEVRRF